MTRKRGYTIKYGQKIIKSTKGRCIIERQTTGRGNPNLLDGSTVFEPGLVKITVERAAHKSPYLYHAQIFWEFVFVESGFALVNCEGASLLLSPGDLFVIAPGETHSLVAAADTVLYSCMFRADELGALRDDIFALPGFSELSARENRRKTDEKTVVRYECVRLDYAERSEFLLLADRMHRERLTKVKGWQILLKSLLCRMLVFYSRLDISGKRAERRADTAKNSTYQIVRFLEENYKSNITGASLSQATGLTADYIARQFKNDFAVSPAEYLRRYRVARAMELLRGTDLSVNEIAERTGFGDVSVFSRIFKTYEGDTPSAYRKRSR